MTGVSNLARVHLFVALVLGIFVFALAMILNILARRFIQKDEKLVRSVDRLR